MKLSDQNTRPSDCLKAAVIDGILGCICLWAFVQYFLPGSEKELNLLLCGLIAAPYCFVLAWRNLVRRAALLGKPVTVRPRRERGPVFFALTGAGDLFLAGYFFWSVAGRGEAGRNWLHLLLSVPGACLFLCLAVVNFRRAVRRNRLR